MVKCQYINSNIGLFGYNPHRFKHGDLNTEWQGTAFFQGSLMAAE